jgi:hypothetical protein
MCPNQHSRILDSQFREDDAAPRAQPRLKPDLLLVNPRDDIYAIYAPAVAKGGQKQLLPFNHTEPEIL